MRSPVTPLVYPRSWGAGTRLRTDDGVSNSQSQMLRLVGKWMSGWVDLKGIMRSQKRFVQALLREVTYHQIITSLRLLSKFSVLRGSGDAFAGKLELRACLPVPALGG